MSEWRLGQRFTNGVGVTFVEVREGGPEGGSRFVCTATPEDAARIVSDHGAAGRLAKAEAELTRLRAHLIEIEKVAARHEESAEWQASAAIPAILGRARRALRGEG